MSTTELSGNELYCLAKRNYHAGNFVIGNSVYSTSFIKSLGSGISATIGQEFKEATRRLCECRTSAYQRMLDQAREQNAHGIVKIKNQLVYYSSCIEFIFSGAIVNTEKNSNKFFATISDGQELYTLLDAGYLPIKVVFGNIVYATGTSLGLFSSLKTLARGEIREYSTKLTQTRQQALERAIKNAIQNDANALLSIKTIFSSIGKAYEFLLIGNACKQSFNPSNTSGEIITSHLTNVEMWNLAKLGFVPVRVLLSSVVFSLGIGTNIHSSLKSIIGSENNQLTKIIADCRDNAINNINQQAKQIGADRVVGTNFYIYQLGTGLIEFFIIGTAVKKSSLASTESEHLLAQAIITDKNKNFDYTDSSFKIDENTPIGSLIRIMLILLVLIGIIWLAIAQHY